ncbi:MAG: amidophosphoribosyltransferase [Cytophagales bacterium]|nr:amidophosphoribosyltransferase [Cytophagales bacterium]MDW8383933.1 amidophosphoribosyltransferase [Flammeovirgaceae bacterium]
MSELIKHECGIAFLRLRKPLQYYLDKYQTPAYAINKLYLLMEKQHNRGQDGAGMASVKIGLKPGISYIDRIRSVEENAIQHIFKKANKKLKKVLEHEPERWLDGEWLKENIPYVAEVYMGHLRYGTSGGNGEAFCHPMLRRNNWRSRNLLLAGNFNMTNNDELFKKLIELGQHPDEMIDTVTVLEKFGHFLDDEVQMLFEKYHAMDYSNYEITEKIENELDMLNIVKRACKDLDGGYALMGINGSGCAFVARDPHGIRPAYYYADDEIIVAASEKPAIKTTFNVEYEAIKEIEPGSALIVNKKGEYNVLPFIQKKEKKSCSFERIYFSRGTDPEIYNERKKLGALLVPQILEAIDYDLENTVFSYIPNTAETAFLGMMDAIEKYLVKERKKAIEEGKIKGAKLEKLLSFRPRMEKLVVKDTKLRTFITDEDHRDDFITHVYDTTYEVIRKKQDTIVVIDDSIVRGSTLERSIITMLDRLEPKCIIIVSSAPQIRYPDCYGIDMAKIGEFVAFRAMIALLEEKGEKYKLQQVYQKCKEADNLDIKKVPNFVKELYEEFTYEEISQKVAQIIKLPHIQAEVKVIYQKVENLHKACPNHLGDWYFTGNYPTAGGNRIVNKAFIHFMEGKKTRAYD